MGKTMKIKQPKLTYYTSFHLTFSILYYKEK